jgi:AAA+ ATPase superfamily predicted ATPase
MKRGQVWVETVVYTLIAFVLIGTVLAFIKPKIDELQDKAIIEQSIGIMEEINNVILSTIQGGAGNKRVIEVSIKKGTLTIDGSENEMVFEIESSYLYSEEGIPINERGVEIITINKGSQNVVNLRNDYSQKYDIAYDGDVEGIKTLSQGSTFHKIFITNLGKEVDSGKWILEVTVE